MHTVRFTRLQGENWVLTQYSWPFCKLKQKRKWESLEMKVAISRKNSWVQLLMRKMTENENKQNSWEPDCASWLNDFLNL